MKFFDLFLQLFTQQAEKSSQQALAAIRKAAILIAISLVAVMMLSLGFSQSFEALMRQIESNGHYSFGRLEIGVFLMIVALLILVLTFRKRLWIKVEASPKRESPLEGAAAVLILEIAKELRERRKSSDQESRKEKSASSGS